MSAVCSACSPKRRDQLDEAVAGDIVAIIGPKDALTGHTLCDAKHPVILESIRFPRDGDQRQRRAAIVRATATS